jgi:S-adenosylmethionine-dependent methyltransferase
MRGKDFGQAAAPAAGFDAERRRAAPPALVADALDAALAARAAQTGRAALDVVDVGAGTGGFAVRLAALGHHVTVVDPSPDALAAARWRAAELGVTLTAVQGEAGDLAALVGEGAADLVVCHNVLEYVDSPAAAMTAIARVLRAGGTVSVLAANVVAAVLQRALAGRYDEARRLLDPRSRSAEGYQPLVPAPGRAPAITEHRRFTLPELTALIESAGLRVGDAQGIRVFAGLLPGAGADPNAADALRDLEAAAAGYPALRDIAARLHVLAFRGEDPPEAARGS